MTGFEGAALLSPCQKSAAPLASADANTLFAGICRHPAARNDVRLHSGHLQSMPHLKYLFAVVFVFITSNIAFAASDQEDGSSHSMKDALLSFLPIAFFLLVLYFFFRRQIKSSPIAKLQQQNIERHIQHMQRMEDLLERVVTAIERNNKP
jgi:hypothetical protein